MDVPRCCTKIDLELQVVVLPWLQHALQAVGHLERFSKLGFLSLSDEKAMVTASKDGYFFQICHDAGELSCHQNALPLGRPTSMTATFPCAFLVLYLDQCHDRTTRNLQYQGHR